MNRRHFRSILCSLVAMIGFSLFANRAYSQQTARPVDFNRDVRPVLARHCFACHGPDKGESGLRLHEAAFLETAADSGVVVAIPENAEESELIRRVTSSDESERMPPEGKGLSEREIDILRRWIDQGAAFSQHWSFQPIQERSIPDTARDPWCRNPIDAFVLQGLHDAGLHPSPEAEAEQLIRRVHFNVLGLPPEPELVQIYRQNPSEEAYLRLVDDLLADPGMGERWARHWLDVVRFAETNSFERDGEKPNAYFYRDYVIRAFNSDLPFNQFIREQLAGDQIDSITVDSLSATAFYRLGIWDDEPADPLQARFDEYDDIVSTIGQAFLGITINCSRCHDHKIDPLPQKDYYQLIAFVRDVTSYGERGDQKTNSQVDVSPPELSKQHQLLHQQLAACREQMEAIERVGIVKMPAEDQRATEGPDRNRVLRQKLRQYLDAEMGKQYSELQSKLRDLRRSLDALPPLQHVLGLAKCDPNPEPTFVMLRGNPHAPGEAVSPGFPEIGGGPRMQFQESDASLRSFGRRRVLADWIASEENWLTARVIVNRIWQHHFGRGIVRSPNNFGQLGDQPTHPELLDWLATELIRNDWNLKAIHRLILTSSTYRMTSQAADVSSSDQQLHQENLDGHLSAPAGSRRHAGIDSDPGNDRFWRFPMRRLSAEEIRDATLAVTGQLNLEKFGPSIYPELGDEVKATQSMPGSGWRESSPSDRARRSVYIHIKRSLIPPELANFDFPETDTSCEARFMTIQPAQALNMINGRFMQLQSKAFAERLVREFPNDRKQQIQRSIELAYARKAGPDDDALANQVISNMTSKYGFDDLQALASYCLVLLNSNEFLFLD